MKTRLIASNEIWAALRCKTKKHGNMRKTSRKWSLLTRSYFVKLPIIFLRIVSNNNAEHHVLAKYHNALRASIIVLDSQMSITSLGSQSQKATCSRTLIADVNWMQSLSRSLFDNARRNSLKRQTTQMLLSREKLFLFFLMKLKKNEGREEKSREGSNHCCGWKNVTQIPHILTWVETMN